MRNHINPNNSFKLQSKIKFIVLSLVLILHITLIFPKNAVSKSPDINAQFFTQTPTLFPWGISNSAIQMQLGEPNDQEKFENTLTYYYNSDKEKSNKYIFQSGALVQINGNLFSSNNPKSALREYRRFFSAATLAFRKPSDSLFTNNSLLTTFAKNAKAQASSNVVDSIEENEINIRALSNGTSWRADWNNDEYNCVLLLEKTATTNYLVSVSFYPSGKTDDDLKKQEQDQKISELQQNLKTSFEKTLRYSPWESSKSSIINNIGEPTNEIRTKNQTKINFITKGQTGLEYFFDSGKLNLIMSVETHHVQKSEMLDWYSKTLIELHSQHNNADFAYYGKQETTPVQTILNSPLRQTLESHFDLKDELQLVWVKADYKVSMLIVKNQNNLFSCFLFYEPSVA